MKIRYRALNCVLVAGLLTSVATSGFAQTTNTDPEYFPEIITLNSTVKTDLGQLSLKKRPDVASFIKTTIADHPSMQAAEAAVDAEQARARGMSRKVYNPELAIDLETAETETATIGLSQTLDRHGKRKALTQSGLDDVLAAQAAFELVEKTLTAELLSALVGHQINYDLVEMSNKKVDFARDFLELANRRKAAGDLAVSDVMTAELALSGSLAELARTVAEMSKAVETLTTLTGSDLGTWPLLIGTPNSELANGWARGPNELPEIRLASAQAQAFRSRIQVAQKLRKTDPNIGARVGVEGSSALFGVSLAIPLQINNNYSDSVDAARADARQADAGMMRVRRQATARMSATRLRLLASEKAWAAWQSTGSSQLEKQRTLLKILWEAGELDAVDYLIQFNQTFEAESASLELKAAYWLSWFDRLDAANTIPLWLETIQ